MIGPTFVEVRNKREENVQIKAGEMPSSWKEEAAKLISVFLS